MNFRCPQNVLHNKGVTLSETLYRIRVKFHSRHIGTSSNILVVLLAFYWTMFSDHTNCQAWILESTDGFLWWHKIFLPIRKYGLNIISYIYLHFLRGMIYVQICHWSLHGNYMGCNSKITETPDLRGYCQQNWLPQLKILCKATFTR